MQVSINGQRTLDIVGTSARSWPINCSAGFIMRDKTNSGWRRTAGIDVYLIERRVYDQENF
jgi:hypothetical protein